MEKPDETLWKFTALDGVEWTFRITMGTVKTVLDETGVKLTDLFYDEKAVAPIVADTFKMLEVMFSALKPQASASGCDFDRFLSTIDGEVMEKANNALLEALTDFFHGPRRNLIRRATQRFKQESERLLNEDIRAAEKAIDQMDMSRFIRQTHTNSGSSLPEHAA